jgi:hypothetical protein
MAKSGKNVHNCGKNVFKSGVFVIKNDQNVNFKILTPNQGTTKYFMDN